MMIRPIASSILIAGLSTLGFAQVYAPGIVIDGNFDDWDGQVAAAVTDGTGDGGTGRDITAVYLANDGAYLYVRLQSANSDAFDGSEFTGIDGDNSTGTGFNLFGAGLGSDTLVFGASVAGETTVGFNTGLGTPSSVAFGPFTATTDVEFAIDLATTIPGDIASAFPGGLGSTIALMYGDGNGGAGDTTSVATYTLATVAAAAGGATLDNFELYDTAGNAAFRTRDTSGSGFSTARTSTGGVSGFALQTAFTTSGTAFDRASVIHRFIAPLDITGATNVTLDVAADAGNPVPAGQDFIVGLYELDGDVFAFGVGVPTATSFTAVSGPGAYGGAGWFLQGISTGDGLADPAEIIGWYAAVGESGTPSPGTFTLSFDNLLAPGAVPVELSAFGLE